MTTSGSNLKTSINRLVIFITLLILFGPVFFNNISAQEPSYSDSFEIVWKTIDERFYDPEFCGIDWQNSYQRFQKLAANCSASEEFCSVTNTMLLELGVSHLGVIPADSPELLGDAQLFEDGSVGIDLRIIQDKAIVTSIEPGSSAEKAGIKAGDEIISIDNLVISELSKSVARELGFPPNLEFSLTSQLQRLLYGDPDTIVIVDYKNADSIRRQDSLVRQSRGNAHFFMENIPAIYADLESRLLSPAIGYLKFNVFHPAILQDILQRIDNLEDTKALIIDIRGNPGGDFNVRKTLAQKLVGYRTLFWIYELRTGRDEIYLDANENAYSGKIVILVDVMSGSSSEEFSGAMQAIGRATIIGQRSRGAVLIMDAMQLPTGETFIFPFGKTLTADGDILEGTGVIPDIPVELEIEQLRHGTDNQLQEAKKYLEAQINNNFSINSHYPKIENPRFILQKAADEHGAEAVLKKYREILTANNEDPTCIAVDVLNTIGYQVMGAGDLAGAITIFTQNTIAYPDTANVWDSLGEAYMKRGDTEKARANYLKVLEIIPDHRSALAALEKLKQKK